MASVTKQFHRLLRNIASFSDGQARVPEDSYDLDELTSFHVVLSPTGGPYRGGTFEFEISFDEDDFPDYMPVVLCLTTIYHPNIDTSDGSVCLNLLDESEEWNSDVTFEDIVQGLLFLMYNPEVSDPLSGFFSGTESEAVFTATVRRTLRGGEFFDTVFPRNLDPAYEDDEVVEDSECAEGRADVEVTAHDGAMSPPASTASAVDGETDGEPIADSDVCVGAASLAVEVDDEKSGGEDTRMGSSESPVHGLLSTHRGSLVSFKSVGRHVARMVRTAVEIFSKYG